MQKNYKEVLERFKDGDSNAYEKLYKLYRAPAFRFCNSILRDREESENIIHDVFLKIWIKRSNINPDLNFESYLLTIVKNHVFDYYKEERRNRLMIEKFGELVSEYMKVNNEIKEERIAKIQEEVGNLSKRRKEILQLNYEEGMSYSEISNQLNISINTVKNQLVISKQTIRERLM